MLTESRHMSTNQTMNPNSNPITTGMSKLLDDENYLRYQQISEAYPQESKALFKNYNLLLTSQPPPSRLPANIEIKDYHIFLHKRLIFFAFRFITDISYQIRQRLVNLDSAKEDTHFLKCVKILLSHTLTSRYDSANFAFLELQQICRIRNLSLETLFNNHRYLVLRLIVKSCLNIMPSIDFNETDRSRSKSLDIDICRNINRSLQIFNKQVISIEDTVQILIIVTNLIAKDRFVDKIKFFLEILATRLGKELPALINDQIHFIMVNLLSRKKLSTFDIDLALKTLATFCNCTPSDLLLSKLTSIKSRIILSYSTEPKMVTDSIYYLAKFEKDENEMPFEAEFDNERHFVEYLAPSIVGILLGVDEYFVSIQEQYDSPKIVYQIKSLCRIIASLNSNEVKVIHVKLLSTISLLVRLRRRRDNYDLNIALCQIWRLFVERLDNDIMESLIINICVNLPELTIDCPDGIAGVYDTLFSQKNLKKYGDTIQSLYFLPEVPCLTQIHQIITSSNRDKIDSLGELETALNPGFKLLKNENQRCQYYGLVKLRDILRMNSNIIRTATLLKSDEPLDKVLSKTIDYILNFSSQNIEISALVADCLGLLGAINPSRLDHFLCSRRQHTNSERITVNLESNEFVIQLIEKLKNSLFSDRKTESETATYALQVVGNLYSVSSNKTVLDKLSFEAKRAWDLCKNTNYRGVKLSQPDMSKTVFEKFKQEQNYSYTEYLDKFSQSIISVIKNKRIQLSLNACSYNYKYNQKLAEHMLPLTVIYMVLNQQTEAKMIKKELLAIIEQNSELATQDFEFAAGFNEDGGKDQTLTFQCTYMVFNILDMVNKLYNNEMTVKADDRRLSPKHLAELKNFYDCLPKNKLAILAAKCRSHARALYYLEQHLCFNKDQFERFAITLQRIYVDLADPYEAAAVNLVRGPSTTVIAEIASNEACGRYERAFNCCLTALKSVENEDDKITLIYDSLKNLSNCGDFQRLNEKSQEFSRAFSNLTRYVLPYAVEAAWKLTKWDELDHLVDANKLEHIVDNSAVAQGYLLNSFMRGQSDIEDRLKIVRHQQMKPLSIAMMDRSAYIRGYQNSLVFHMLTDFELLVETSNLIAEKDIENSIDIDSLLTKLLCTWRQRNKLVQPTLKSLEPLLVWQRAMIDLLSKKHIVIDRLKLKSEVGNLWLASAELARDAKSYERAFFSLTQTKELISEQFRDDPIDIGTVARFNIEQSKLYWDMGERTLAIRNLKSTLNSLKHHPLHKHLAGRQSKPSDKVDDIPDLTKNSPCDFCRNYNRNERESFANLKILLTYYSEEAAAAIPETLFFMYEECVHLGVKQEETYFRLARYYDRLYAYYVENPHLCGEQDTRAELDNRYEPPTQRFSQPFMSGDKEEVYTKLMLYSVVSFGMSLVYGVRYIRESMPRMLNIWYELGTKKVKSNQPVPTRSIGTHIECSIRFIDTLAKKIPSYYFMPALSLLLSRIKHPHTGMTKKTNEILLSLLGKYPNQMTWHLVSITHDDNLERRKSAVHLLQTAKRAFPQHEKIIKHTIDFTSMINDICTNYSSYGSSTNMKSKLKPGPLALKKLCPAAEKFNSDICSVMMPTQESLYAALPTEEPKESSGSFEVFSRRNITFVSKFEPTCLVFHSQQQPRKITILCDDGKSRSLLCKAGDDLRKDNRCIEFFNLINRVLRRDNQSNARFFEIQTFLVLPITSISGILEWLPNLVTFRNIVENLYKEQNPNFIINEIYPKKSKEWSPEEQYNMFVNDVIPRVQPPVLPTWFLRNYNDPSSWYTARLAFTRSTAVISMGGYIIGLGDRHMENVLLDSVTGKSVHVDFNLLFHQGETLHVPERVPFRLTHNMIAAFGTLGHEGNFRRASEITMKVMRKEKDALLTTLRPFISDPCSDWIKAIHSRGDDKGSYANWPAKVKIQITERKLKGFPRSRKFKPLTLIDSYSVEAQVDNLIEEATDNYNLCQMYSGWCPHI